MEILESTLLGTYSPVWKAITIYHENISNMEKNNAHILTHLVTAHEHYHWLQLAATSLGHIISLAPLFHKNIVSMYCSIAMDDALMSKKPLMPKAMASTSTADTSLVVDTNAVRTAIAFLEEDISREEWLQRGSQINNALFGMYDIYLQNSQHILENLHGRDRYQELVRENRMFWDRQENFSFMFLNRPSLLGFRNLVECAARIFEIRYYRDMVTKHALMNIDATIEDDYLYHNPQYFRPLDSIQELFPHDYAPEKMDDIFQFLLTAIHISINPPVVPFFNLAWQPSVSINDIHPGVRFLRICLKVQELYGSCVEASKDPELYSIICAAMCWPDDKSLFSSIETAYRQFVERIAEHDDGKSFISNNLLYEFDYYLYKYYRYNATKAQHTEYFIDAAKFLASEDNMAVAMEVDNSIHCPVIFDEASSQFRVNVSRLNFDVMNEAGEIMKTFSSAKEFSDAVQQESVNILVTGIFYNLDKQLLYDNGGFNLDILNQIDAPQTLKEDIVQMYNKERHLNLSLKTA